MEEIEYIHWEDVYRDKWLHRYRELVSFKKSSTELSQDVYDLFSNFFKWSVYLIQIYMRNYGYYYGGDMIIKVAFRIGIIKDGDTFIVINDMMENSEKYNKREALEYCLGEGFHVFDDINAKMKELLGQE